MTGFDNSWRCNYDNNKSCPSGGCPLGECARRKTTPKLGDSSDVAIEEAKQKLLTSKKISGWTVEEWIDYFDRNPFANAPSGVAIAIINWFKNGT